MTILVVADISEYVIIIININIKILALPNKPFIYLFFSMRMITIE